MTSQIVNENDTVKPLGSSVSTTNTPDINDGFVRLTTEEQRELELELPEIEQELTDSEEEDEFIRRFGDIEFQYIKPPKQNFWFKRPHALNFLKMVFFIELKENVHLLKLNYF